MARPRSVPILGRTLPAAVAAWAVLAAPAPAASGASCPSAAVQGRAAAAAGFAEGRYRLEAGGAAVRAALARVTADRALSDAVRAGNLGAAAAAAVREVRGHHHITAIRVVRGSRVLVETTRYPFDVAGARAVLRDRHGTNVGTVVVTIQDVIGFIRLVHKFTGAEVVVRGAGGTVKSSLPAAVGVQLPAAGCAGVAGRSYAVRSFTEIDFTGETLRISVLRAA